MADKWPHVPVCWIDQRRCVRAAQFSLPFCISQWVLRCVIPVSGILQSSLEATTGIKITKAAVIRSD